MTMTYRGFTCTLEGFDDPLPLLVAVTPQFRTIADAGGLTSAQQRAAAQGDGPTSQADNAVAAAQRILDIARANGADAVIDGHAIALRATSPLPRAPSPQRAADPATEPGADPAIQHGADPATQHGADPATQRGADPATQPGADPATGNALLARQQRIRTAVAQMRNIPEPRLPVGPGSAGRPAAAVGPVAADMSRGDAPLPIAADRTQDRAAAVPVLRLTGAILPGAMPDRPGAPGARISGNGVSPDGAGPPPDRPDRHAETARAAAASTPPTDATASEAPIAVDRPRPAGQNTRLEASAREQDAALERLLHQADSEFDEPAHRRRFSAIAHLKAAVAATEADRYAAHLTGVPRPVPLDRFRDDLAQAQRSGAQSVTSGAAAPLILGISNRIDLPPSGADARPRPRRMATGGGAVARRAAGTAFAGGEIGDEDIADGDDEPDGIDDDANLAAGDAAAHVAGRNGPHGPAARAASDDSFGAFASRHGAHGLTDLLEAAAAHTAAIEGREHFSRPHIVRKVVAHGAGQGITREDGLRSFAMLLRQGRIYAVNRGRFALAADSRYLRGGARQTR